MLTKRIDAQPPVQLKIVTRYALLGSDRNSEADNRFRGCLWERKIFNQHLYDLKLCPENIDYVGKTILETNSKLTSSSEESHNLDGKSSDGLLIGVPHFHLILSCTAAFSRTSSAPILSSLSTRMHTFSNCSFGTPESSSTHLSLGYKKKSSRSPSTPIMNRSIKVSSFAFFLKY